MRVFEPPISLARLAQKNDLDLYLFVAGAGELHELRSLALTGYELKLSQLRTVAFDRIHTLRIEDCRVGVNRVLFAAFLDRCLPALRVFDWRRNDFIGMHDVPYSAAELLGSRHVPRIETCVLLGERYGRYPGDCTTVITLGAMDAFASLCSLTIDNNMLFTLAQPPPRLSELIVVFARNFMDCSKSSVVGDRRRALLLTVAGFLKGRVPYWLQWFSPSLCSVQIWDSGDLSVPYDWGIVAYLLRDSLLRFKVELVVNLRLSWSAEITVFRRAKMWDIICRLFWKGVI